MYLADHAKRVRKKKNKWRNNFSALRRCFYLHLDQNKHNVSVGIICLYFKNVYKVVFYIINNNPKGMSNNLSF